MADNDATAKEIPARKRLGLLGRKVGMTQLLLADGRSVPVTVIQAGPCTVLQRKTAEKDGYTATKHEREVGAGYFDDVTQTVTAGQSSVTAMKGSTEEEQFAVG